MLADLDLLRTAVFCIADDLLPEKGRNARRSVTDAESDGRGDRLARGCPGDSLAA
jgi:hypothetical protein